MTTRIVLDAAHWRARLIVFRRRREDALAGLVRKVYRVTRRKAKQ